MKIHSIAAFLFANSGRQPLGNVGVSVSVDPSSMNMNSLARALPQEGNPFTTTSMSMSSDPVADAFSNMNSQMVQKDHETLKELQALSDSFKKLAQSDTSKLFGGKMRVAKGLVSVPDQKKMFAAMEYNIITESNKLIGFGKNSRPPASGSFAALTVESDQRKRFTSMEYNIKTESSKLLGPDPSQVSSLPKLGNRTPVEADQGKRFSSMEQIIKSESNKLIGPDPSQVASMPNLGDRKPVEADQGKRFSSMEEIILTESNQLIKGPNQANNHNFRKTTELVGPDPKDTKEYREKIKHGFRTEGGGMDNPGAPSFNPFQS